MAPRCCPHPSRAACKPPRKARLAIIAGGQADAFERVEPILRQLGAHGDLRRRRRPRPAAQAGHQHQPRGADARLQRRRAARRTGRGRPRRRPPGDDAQRDRLTDAAGPRGAAARAARQRLVRCGHDAEGPPAGTRHGRDEGLPMPSTTVADQMLSTARAAGYEHRDIAVMFRVLSDMVAAPPSGPRDRSPYDKHRRRAPAHPDGRAARRHTKRSSRPRWNSCSTKACTP